jgi:hypothetical protein
MSNPFVVQHSVTQHFLKPLTGLLPQVTNSRICPKLGDEAFLRVGVSRVLSQAKSGRDFLQIHAESGGERIEVSHFFDLLNSTRRLAVCSELNKLLCTEVGLRCSDPFLNIPELEAFDLYAGDGHYIKASTHDGRFDGKKQPVGNFYIFNLRSRALQHFELGVTDKDSERKKEHDMHAIKRVGMAALRFDAKKGRKVIIVWDKAGIDFAHWNKAKERGVYFVSREKDNMRLETVEVLDFDKTCACNEGVLTDEIVVSIHKVILRRIVYVDSVNGVEYTYLTTNLKLTPGIIALLYKRRWDIEKAFDETENRFQENKAWAKSLTSKRMQAEFICITYNLFLLVEELLETRDDIRNQPEIDRRAKRQAELEAELTLKHQKLPYIHRIINRITQRGVKLIRWIRNYLYSPQHWDEAVEMLRFAYLRL